jgi:dienelactone hydrolase
MRTLAHSLIVSAGGLLLAALSGASWSNDLALHVKPESRLLTEPASVFVGGAPPGAEIVIEATLTEQSGQRWSSRGVYFARHDGSVDTAEMASLAGTYTGVDAEGLFWSMLPVAPATLDAASRAKRGEDWPTFPAFDSWNAPYELRRAPVEVSFSARLAGAPGSVPTASTSQSVFFIADGVRRVPVAEGDLRGVLYEAAGQDPHPLAMVVTGSGGGVNEGKAALLASHGITTLALAHFNYPGRPEMLLNIPVEYFSQAMNWLAGRYGQERIAILGGSRGGEGVLLIAATYPEQVSAVVAEVPSNVLFGGCCTEDGGTGPAWTLDGEPLPYVDWEDQSPFREAEIWAPGKAWREVFRRGITELPLNDPRAIPVENIKSPLLLVTGDADGLWAGDIAATRVLERLRANDFSYPAEHLNYAGAGHIVAMPMLVKSLADRMRSKSYGYLAMGGIPQANAHAQTDAFRRTLAFLRLHESSAD